MRKIFVLLSVILNYAYATTNDCETLFKEEQYTAAAPICKKMAKADNTVAQRCLGLMYVKGAGVGMNIESGFNLLSQAAQKGDANAQRSLGGLYAIGGANESALFWITKAAQNGDPEAKAMFNMK